MMGRVVDQDPRPTGRPNARMRQTIGDMVRSMLVVLAFVAVLLFVTWRPQPEAVKVVDTTPVVLVASTQADFAVAVPTDLPDGWRPTSARWETTEKSVPDPVLHIGYVTPTDSYAQVSQSANATAPYTAEQTDDGIAVGTQAVDDVDWERWEHGDRHSLVRIADGTTTIVSGTASWDELIALAASLNAPAAAG